MQAAPPLEETAIKPFRVVIADDSTAIRHSLSTLVSRLKGVEIVGVAGTGIEALELVRALKPDAVTLDIRMPGMNGIAVLEGIQKERLEIVPIVLTGVAEEEYRRKCLESGARHFFNKTTEFELLINVLTELAAHHRAQN